MGDTLRLGLVQMTATADRASNIAAVRDAASRAAGEGCALLALPEMAGLMNASAKEVRAQITDAAHDPYISACQDIAAEHGMWIATGSTPVASGEGRFLNRSNLIDAEGAVVATYDKIHLFDAFLDGERPTGESRRYAPGETAVLAQTPWGPWGLSVCYDLRFPQLYRAYAQAGATLFLVPSAFTVPTGRAHWEVLLRARAIENGAWVVAPAQVGQHDDGRRTYGHSMIVDPWGRVVTDLGETGPEIAVATLDLAQVAAARRQIPSLEHDRPFRLPSTEPMPAAVSVR